MKSINTKIVIEELHRAFNMFNENLFQGELPEPAILIQSRGNKKLTLGWCSVKQIWKNEITMEEKYEINIVAEALNRGVYPVMATLLHEMVHLHNLVKGIKDTSRGFTYHNMKYKKTAEAHGLIVDHADKIGWSVTKLSGLTMDLVDKYEFDEAVFSLGRRDINFDGAGKPRKKVKTSSRKYICPVCGTSIRASKDVNILCGDCTDIEEGKIVLMLKEITEDDEDNEQDESNGQDGQEEPISIPTEEKEEKICQYCGSVVEVPEGQALCPECGECGLLTMEQFESIVKPVEQEKEEDKEDKESIEIIEVDTKLIDGDGKKVAVKQGMIKIDWTLEEIEKQLIKFKEHVQNSGIKAPDLPEIEISKKLNQQYARYKEGSKIILSEKFLKSESDTKVIEVLKHVYIHHLEFINTGTKQNHKAPFKAICEAVGISPKTENKNHRAMY